jgi:hypothetical protein
LVGGDSARVVAFAGEADELRCWPLAGPPARPQVETPALLEINTDTPARGQATIELLADLDGPERVEFELVEGELRLRVMSATNVQQLGWAESANCEFNEASVRAHLLEPGVAFELTLDCDDCTDCDDASSWSDQEFELWWPRTGGPLVTSAHSTSRETEVTGSGSYESRADTTARVWPLAAARLVHWSSGERRSTSEIICDDDDPDDCCVEDEDQESDAETWTLEDAAGDPLFEREVRDNTPAPELTRDCE